MSKTNDLSKIAIIGMACKFPEADNVEQYWDNLINGRESISFLSQEELIKGKVDEKLRDNPNYVNAGSFIEGFEYFDNHFFNYTLKEASVIDPQHRLFLEYAWHALEDACVKPGDTRHRIGVFAGCHMNSYLLNVISNPDIAELIGELNVELGNEKDYLATRVSYKMDLRGPSMNIQTACSSSLVAVHMAVQSLLNGECDIALAGGVAINDFERKGYIYQPGGIKSPDGHCRTFDSEAEGTIFGNGLGVVVLKRLKEAKEDGNNIYASIIGTAVNNDGADKVGLAAPGLNGQRDVIEEAILVAGIEPFDLSYIECHGTATRLGDSIEVSALKNVFNGYSGEGKKCGIGSVKTNVGHLNKASGIAGLIKTVLAIKNKVIPPTIHFSKPNPLLELDNSPFYVVDKLVDLSNQKSVLRAGVSSFGIGGTNAHVILEEFAAQKQEDSPRNLYLLPYSGKTKSALIRVGENINRLLKNCENNSIEDIEYSLQQGRFFFPYRKFIIVDRDKTIKLTTENVQAEIFGNEDEELQLVFRGVFYSGQIDGACGYLKELTRADDYFKKLIEPLVNEVCKTTNLDFSHLEKINLSIKTTNLIASFILQAVIAGVLAEFSVKYEFTAGINDGELAAACSAGVISWREGLLLLLVREKIIDQSAIAFIKFSSPKTHLFLGKNRDGNSTCNCLSLDYWLLEEKSNISEEEFMRSCFHNNSFDRNTLIIRTGMKGNQLKDGKGDVIKVINSIDFIDNQISILPLLGKLWANRLVDGFDVYSQSHPAHFVTLYPYPFEKTKCWLTLKEDIFKEKLKSKSVEDFIYEPVWQQLRQKKTFISSSKKYWLFMKGKDRWTEALKEEVCKEGHMVIPFDQGEKAGEEAKSNAHIKNPEDYQECLDFFTGLREMGICPEYFVYSLIAETPEMSSLLLTNQKTHLFALLHITCAFEEVFNKEAKILVLSNNVYSILGEQMENYFASIFQGACIVIPQEFSRISCLAIDVDSAEYGPSAGMYQKIINEIQQVRGGKLLAYRKKIFWKKTYEKVDDFTEVSKNNLAISPTGVYVITGGTGGIGLEVIEYLINHKNPKIAVISRNPRREQRFDELVKKAVELKLFKADVTNEKALEQVFQEIYTDMGEIKGIFHLAGLPGKGMIINKKKNELDDVLGPKLDGTLFLGSILKKYDPDFFILFSSTIALKGGTGQIDYCGANNFLDNYALYNTQQGVRTVSINWDAWRNTGMTGGLPGNGEGLSHKQALDCLDYILRSLDNPRVVVSVNDVNRLLTPTTRPVLPSIEEVKCVLSEDISYEFVFNKLTELVTLITGKDEIDPDILLEDIGIDSVLILQLLNEIDRVFPGTFSVSKFYIYSTLNTMADHIYSELTESLAQTDKYNEPDHKLEDYLKKIKDDDVSINEVLRYLSKEESKDE